MLLVPRGRGLAQVPGINAGGSAGTEHITPQLSRGRQRPRDQCGVKEIRLRTLGFLQLPSPRKAGVYGLLVIAN